MFKQTSFVFFLIITFVWALAWMGFNIYHNSTTSTISAELQQEVTPLNGTFDQTEIQAILHRQQLSPIYSFKDATASAATTVTPASPQPTQALSPQPTEAIASPSATASPAPTTATLLTPTGG